MDSSRSSKKQAVDLLSQCGAFGEEQVCGDVRDFEGAFAISEFGNSEHLLERNTVFVGSSRLPQKLDEIPELFDGLLKLAVQLDPERDVLLTGQGTACDLMVRRIGELFRIPVVEVCLAPSDVGKLSGLVQEFSEVGVDRILVFDFDKRGLDFALATLAVQMTVLSMRSKGKLQTAVLQRLEDGKSTRVLVEPTLTKQPLTEELLSSGAAGWYLFGDADLPETGTLQRDVSRVSNVESEKYLLHWTRRRVGPWPEQSESDFMDDLIFRCSRKDHREVAALRRILATERILASSTLTRDPRPVVCFSDVTFEELKERRVFRQHLHRWDFEPYGFAIDRDWLSEQGCRSVTYGDDQVWETTDESDRPFFQLNDPNGKIDWSVEKEWRVVGDVDLRKVPVDAAVVFVPTIEDAEEVGDLCRWPIVVLES
jgi:hypothetical protein